jgi:hypothetical protein
MIGNMILRPIVLYSCQYAMITEYPFDFHHSLTSKCTTCITCAWGVLPSLLTVCPLFLTASPFIHLSSSLDTLLSILFHNVNNPIFPLSVHRLSELSCIPFLASSRSTCPCPMLKSTHCLVINISNTMLFPGESYDIFECMC